MEKPFKYILGDILFKAVTAIPSVHSWLSRRLISAYADGGPLPGLYTTEGDGLVSLHEMLDKQHFSLEVPKPTPEQIAALPEIEELKSLFERKKGGIKKVRVSLLLPFFAQHLTDAVFQSKGSEEIETDAPHEIILNQIYGNTRSDEQALRSGVDGKLKSRLVGEGKNAPEFPETLFCQVGDQWQIKEEFKNLSYLTEQKLEKLLNAYLGREQDICAVGLFQGNMTLGNFAITTLFLREHNRLCEGVKKELERKGIPATDELIFRKAQQINITTYMKLVVEDYINAFAGQKLFKLDTRSFFYEKKRWCRESPIPFHFNILYRFHGMIPDTLKGHEHLGFNAFRANNGLVMRQGLGPLLHLASSQAAASLEIGNTHKDLMRVEKLTLEKARLNLGALNAHRELQKKGSSLQFADYNKNVQDALKKLYRGDPDKVEYAVGIFAEPPKNGLLEKLGIRGEAFIGSTIMSAIAKHAFRHILSNRLMSREFLNPAVMTEFGWKSLHDTKSVEQLVKRNVPEMDSKECGKLRINFDAPAAGKAAKASDNADPDIKDQELPTSANF